MDKTQAFITLLYVFVVDYVKNGSTGRSKEVFDQLRDAYRGADLSLKKAIQPELDDAMVAAGRNPSGKEVAYGQLGFAVKNAIPFFVQNRSLNAQQLEVIKAFGLYMRSGSEASFNKLTKLANVITGNAWIASNLDVGHGEQDDNDLRNLVYKLVRRKDNKLTIEESNKARTEYPELYKEYLALRRSYTQVFKDAMASFVRSSGKGLVPMKSLEQYFKTKGIETTLPIGFNGLVDDLGNFYTHDKKPIDGVPNSTTFPKILMNKNFGTTNGGNWVFMAVRTDGSPGPYFYTKEFKKAQVVKKFGKVQDFSKVVEAMRKRWIQRVKRFDVNEKQDAAAVILDLLYTFSARVGTVGNKANGEPTFGISTLLVKHSYPQSNGDIVLKYLGKDAVVTKHKVLSNDPLQKYLAAAIHVMREGKKPSERLFTYDKGPRRIPISPKIVNDYFRTLGPPDGVTVHKLRTVKGTKIFTALMEAQFAKSDRVQPKTEKEALDLLKKMATQVGKALNHVRRSPTGEQTVTPNTALQNYIDVALQREYYDRLDIRYPKFLEKLM